MCCKYLSLLWTCLFTVYNYSCSQLLHVLRSWRLFSCIIFWNLYCFFFLKFDFMCGRNPVLFFPYGCLVIPALYIENTIFSPLFCSAALSEITDHMGVWVCFSTAVLFYFSVYLHCSKTILSFQGFVFWLFLAFDISI